ncbi:MAG TPA: hypothetical protein VN203_02885 [Candidatus Acidoferrum sp.]|nr:hypothetical protein [Candidatus Acidoferrum sp.]
MTRRAGGYRQGCGVSIVIALEIYTDDFVILCRHTAAQVQPLVTQQLQPLGLTLNAAKIQLSASQRIARVSESPYYGSIETVGDGTGLQIRSLV